MASRPPSRSSIVIPYPSFPPRDRPGPLSFRSGAAMRPAPPAGPPEGLGILPQPPPSRARFPDAAPEAGPPASPQNCPQQLRQGRAPRTGGHPCPCIVHRQGSSQRDPASYPRSRALRSGVLVPGPHAVQQKPAPGMRTRLTAPSRSAVPAGKAPLTASPSTRETAVIIVVTPASTRDGPGGMAIPRLPQAAASTRYPDYRPGQNTALLSAPNTVP